MDLVSRYFCPWMKTSRRDGVVDYSKVTSYNVGCRIIYEWGTCTCAIRRFRLEIVNIEILQHLLVVKYFVCNRCGIGIGDFR